MYVHFKVMFEGLKNGRECLVSICSLFPQVNGTEIEYEFEEITLERVSLSDPTAAVCLTYENQ